MAPQLLLFVNKTNNRSKASQEDIELAMRINELPPEMRDIVISLVNAISEEQKQEEKGEK